jgi:hypothetical protein
VTDAYRFIAAEKANYSVSLMSRMLGVNRQAFHAWERRPPSQRSLEDAFLTERIPSERGIGCDRRDDDAPWPVPRRHDQRPQRPQPGSRQLGGALSRLGAKSG